MNISDFHFFDITVQGLNLFSFVLGMFYASTLSWYRRTAFIQVVIYFMGLALWYWAKYYFQTHQ